MSTEYCDPTSDVTNNWTKSTGSTGWGVIDDAVRQPSNPTVPGDYISSSTPAQVEECKFPAPAVTPPDFNSVAVHVYAAGGAKRRIDLQVFEGANTRSSVVTVAAGAAAAWYNLPLTSQPTNWANLSIRMTCVSAGGSTATAVTVYEAYLDATVPDPVALSATLGGSGGITATLTAPEAGPVGMTASLVGTGTISLANLIAPGAIALSATLSAVGSVVARLGAYSAYATDVLSDTPVGYWKLNETSGVAYDHGSGRHDGTYAGAPLRGQASALDTETDGSVALRVAQTGDYIDFGDNNPLTDAAGCAIELWFQWNQAAAARASETLVAKGNTTWRIARDASTSNIRFQFDGAGAPINLVTPWFAATPANHGPFNAYPHHLVATYDADAGVAQLWIDGIKRAEQTGIAFTPNTNTSAMRLGSNSGAAGREFQGGMDELAVYDHPLTPDRIRSHYDKGINALSSFVDNFDIDLSNWTLSGTGGINLPQLSGGKLFSGSTTGIGVAQRRLRMNSGCGRLVARMNWVHTGADRSAVFGIYLSGDAGTTIVTPDTTQTALIGINGGTTAGKWDAVHGLKGDGLGITWWPRDNGAGSEGTNTGAGSSSGKVDPVSADYLIGVTWDETCISFFLRKAVNDASTGTADEWRLVLPRSEIAFCPDQIGLYCLDLSRLSGASFEVVGYRTDSLDPISPKTGLEDALPIPHTTLINGTLCRIMLPTSYTPGTPAPVLLWNHGGNGPRYWDDNPYQRDIQESGEGLGANSPIMASSDMHGYGAVDPQSIADNEGLLAWLDAHFSIDKSKLLIWGSSAGSMITYRMVFNPPSGWSILAAILSQPLLNIHWYADPGGVSCPNGMVALECQLWGATQPPPGDQLFDASVNRPEFAAAYGLPTDYTDAQYHAEVFDSIDPVLLPKSAWGSAPLLIEQSSTDTHLHKADNLDMLWPILTAGGRIHTFYVNGDKGDHGTPGNFTLTDYNWFVRSVLTDDWSPWAYAVLSSGPESITANLSVATGVVAADMSATLSAVGTVTAAPYVGAQGSATLSAVGTVSAAANVNARATATLAGVGTVTANARTVAVLTSTLAGAGTLTASLSTTVVGLTATLSGTGSLVPNLSLPAIPLTATLSAVGSATANLTAGTASMSATLGAVGSLTSTLSGPSRMAVTLDGVGTLTANVRTPALFSTTLVGTSSVTATVTAGTASMAATLAGTGSITSSLSVTALASVTLAGVGSITANLGVTSIAPALMSATISGTGSATGNVRTNAVLIAALDGIGSLTAAPRTADQIAAILLGTGSVTASLSTATIGAVNMSAVLSGVGSVGASLQTGSPMVATLQGTSTVTANIQAVPRLTATLTGGGTLAGNLTVPGAASMSSTLDGAGFLSASLRTTPQLTGSFGGVGTLAGNLTVPGAVGMTASLGAVGSLTANFSVSARMSSTLDGVSSISANMVVRAFALATATLEGTGSITSNLRTLSQLTSSLSGVGAVTASLKVGVQVSATLAGIGSVTGVLTILSEASLTATVSATSTVSANATVHRAPPRLTSPGEPILVTPPEPILEVSR